MTGTPVFGLHVKDPIANPNVRVESRAHRKVVRLPARRAMCRLGSKNNCEFI
jgi:hypothetical protein